jgi:ribosomal protein S12 methylthiotransferase accessory factor YcaO
MAGGASVPDIRIVTSTQVLAAAGDPDECVDKLQEMKERFGITEFVLWSSIGGIPAELARNRRNWRPRGVSRGCDNAGRNPNNE